ncbi:SPFH domain-containing protein [Aliarcobacter butzleri]|uniref:SPFH/Band 7/PHB domain protein n=2 Tax=Aliarcobacter butzleri TaxID=28197 RepID=A0AAW7Q2I4_9BACT|nr:SPFH domain-containing protein [Aliarcobacter butzleri]ABV67345.1 putative protease [Aliarcobacter butzleri RM4018]MCG3655292.1 SPFH/Band 7/PHB domain protein [Aliarcobacter butzleri]MCG3658533.1 SPFH/Band 7/PHB domain protein [Aliarcobacter butzleri]MCG3664343.1 SPFH/Band 7/PHB domain protein [Aliarcobacter butzleri]MCT7596551.1 SPFH/Band 7/PHB domain protein [Aliarcobacter butzleri]
MEGSIVFAVAIIFFAIIIISKGVKIVSQSDLYVVERLGKFNKVLHGGFHIIIPVVDRVRAILTSREQLVDIEKQSVITKDNVNISIDGIVFCKVDDAVQATYNVINFKDAIANLAMTTLRAEIGGMDLDDTLSNRETLNAKLQSELGSAATNWGIKVTRVEIADISVPPSIEKAMNMQMEAEREKRAIQTRAEAQKEAQIREAEAFKQSEILKAEAIERMANAKRYEQEQLAAGQQEAMRLINISMMENEKAAEFLLAKDRIVAFKALAESSSTDKMILPYDVTSMIGSTSVLGDAFFKGVSNGNSNNA